ncbi:leukocyte receptor cluster member 8 homolog [Sipha flava]|uniref:Leukocyte receptor cluster member 8 n=1 Tax=Sipha flava TaxID=143950 RepID=A0A2S2Q615_9HEMI|nr:leukocyte receptor cluster member 8 homolog [Sipha flava]XP_025416272.1 leukocyte receptor cluster member 8 homolog [Sipha flava]XP_025416273.1 leukocyte receptor cluster member 8 homolog [Sipha flava]XP_025416275.1 leukocyte receptor cluster member 8 homolog [Sipha flava]XP_025416276.1 leukocyte receptor cluster member 8 homolog [Sipha flava]XP_025416277.1 leukocyte receptor cluster member 8 homolog [Sipha flava]
MADQNQNQGTPGTPYSNWSQSMNWSYGNYNAGSQMYNMNAFYTAQCYNQQGYQNFPSQSLSFSYKPFVNGNDSTSVVQGNGLSGNSPPLPNGPAPSQPPTPQFDSEDLDKLPPLPPGSPPPVPGICDVPLPPQPNLSSLPPMPQTKSGRKKWRKKQRNLMEAAMANQSTQVAPTIYPSIHFVPAVPILQPPPTPKPMVSSSYSFTPIVPSNPQPQPLPKPSMEMIPTVQKKQNGFDLPDNCPTSLRDYIKKCQDKCVNKIDRDRMDIILKGKVTNANHDGSLWIKDWSKEPMPMLLSENITINQNHENGKNKNSIIKIAFKKSTNNYVNCYFTSKFKSCLPSPSTSNESNNDTIKKNNSPLRDNKKQNSDDFIPLSVCSDESNSKKSKFTNKNKKLYNEDAHIYQKYGSVDSKPNYDKHLLTKRAARFSAQGSPKKKPRQMLKMDYHTQKSFIDDDEFHIDSCHIVGTCIDLEKKYLRLTAAPDADAVRPLRILIKSLQHVKSKWMSDGDYLFACDQLKSIRQDLTVQGIRDPFTVEVYETHARIALEKSDMGEFNQCQTQLCDLYEELKDNPSAQKHRNEFLCYSILYCIYTRAICELNNIILYIKELDIKDNCVDFALKTKDAWWLGNHIQLFSLYKVAPKMAPYLMDMFLTRERNNFYLAIAKSYRPTIPISTIQDQMAFVKREDCMAFLKAAGAVFSSNNENIDCKASCGSTEA